MVYNENIANNIRNAKKSIHIYFQMLRPSIGNAYPSLINEAIKERVDKGDIEIYILTAKEYDRVAGAYELKNILIENNIYFSNKLRITDLRYTLIDRKKVIIGINKDKPISSKYNPSDTWLEVNSIRLGEILEKNFKEVLNESEKYNSFLTQIVSKYTDGKKENFEIASQQLNIPVQEISEYFDENSKTTIKLNVTKKNEQFDVFMAHNNLDKQFIQNLTEQLRGFDITPWLDTEQIPPGRWFQDVIQNAIRNVNTAAIFIGESGIGKWQALELKTFVSQCVENEIPVIPVLLPNVQEIPDNLLFLRELNYVSFQNENDSSAIKKLVWGIKG